MMNRLQEKDNIIRCQRCVMDTTAENIEFDSLGYCNYCEDFLNRTSQYHELNVHQKNEELENLISHIKNENKNKPYDCIVGVSGGIDSSWTLVKVKELGLRALAVHMDNGWNSELAQNNISNLVKKLDIDLYTYVIDWDEYKNLMQSFFDADVIDIELLYDNAMLAVNYRLAAKYNLKTILAGTNHATEGMNMPPNWNWYKYDKRNIKNIAKINHVKIKSFPLIGIMDVFYFLSISNIKWISFLDYLDYDKEEATVALENEYNFVRYPNKHYESIFTRFYQGYILPKKFNVDKRKVHLSNLIMTKQITREEAIEILKNDPYDGNKENLNKDLKYFLKKMSWDMSELEEYLQREEVSHHKFGSDLDKRKSVGLLQKIVYVFKNPLRIIKKRIFGIESKTK